MSQRSNFGKRTLIRERRDGLTKERKGGILACHRYHVESFNCNCHPLLLLLGFLRAGTSDNDLPLRSQQVDGRYMLCVHT